MVAGKSVREISEQDGLVQFQVNGKSVGMEYRRLQNLQRGLGCSVGKDAGMILDSLRYILKRQMGTCAVSRHHVESDLDAVKGFRQFLKGKQFNRLPVELLHS